MTSIILNTIFYPDITNIIIEYIMIKKNKVVYRKKNLMLSILLNRRKKLLYKKDFILDEDYYEEYQRVNELIFEIYRKKALPKKIIFNI